MHRMTRCLLAPLLLAVTALGAQAAPARTPAAAPAPSATPAAPVPLLWKVTGKGDAALYLLGSFHLLRAEDYPLAKVTDQAFAASQRVLFELSPADMASPQMASTLVQAAVRTDGRQLRDELDEPTWTRLQAYAAANNLPLAQLQGMQAWFVGLSISIGQMTKLGLDPKLGLDQHFMQRAQQAGKQVGGLEDIQTQVAVLAGMSADEQRQMRVEALEQADKGDAEVRQLHDAWRRGDDAVLWKEMAASMRQKYPALYKRINSDRNDAWVPKLERHLQAGQGSSLVVVGTLHLLGSDGVVEKLRGKGYKVERLR